MQESEGDLAGDSILRAWFTGRVLCSCLSVRHKCQVHHNMLSPKNNGFSVFCFLSHTKSSGRPAKKVISNPLSLQTQKGSQDVKKSILLLYLRMILVIFHCFPSWLVQFLISKVCMLIENQWYVVNCLLTNTNNGYILLSERCFFLLLEY